MNLMWLVCAKTYIPNSINIVILGSLTSEPSKLTTPPTITNHTQCGPIM